MGVFSLLITDPEYCGDSHRMMVYNTTCTTTSLPNFYSCGPGSPGKNMPFCDHTLQKDDRIKDLLSRMSLEEKCGQTAEVMPAIPEIGYQGYSWC